MVVMHVADDDIPHRGGIDADRQQPVARRVQESRPRFFAIASSKPVSRISVRSSPTIVQTK